MKSQAWCEGVDARTEGKSMDECEYPEGSEEREDWESGYIQTKMAEAGTVEGFFTV